ncbi:unnamed protein product (macronuclear) [Paramecium tetraurelia]|uniref:Uncharacterized protein n=1 Tax=Paramecium tetraurelia TaxID=5888 RepID=A0EBG5_PARTE|nr:uncharacterized protein GSPATT00025366001 [Paramecium tetraurelia]CAK92632.1 unnamed protein product [Paramecium tetraurelia]|eukprot:XP_001460029.1 hypothetical protein (macronuclear) [Paramecium tetraurelia strain d4-2]
MFCPLMLNKEQQMFNVQQYKQLMSKRPPVPKFEERSQTPPKRNSLFDEITHLIIKFNLNALIEKQCVQIMTIIQLPNTNFHAQAIVCCAMLQLNLEQSMFPQKIQQFAQHINYRLNNMLTQLCEKLQMDKKQKMLCQLMHKIIHKYVNKLSKPIQHALAVKIACDIIYYHKGGISLSLLAQSSQVKIDQLQSCLNRIKPFAHTIIQNYINYCKQHKESQ